MTFIKLGRAVSYIAYAYTLVAATFLTIGFFLLLFGANTQSGFVTFVYKVAKEFLEPFREIFPLHQITQTGYFSASALFAIIIYLFLAFLLSSLINYLNLKMYQHAAELDALEAKERK